MKVVLLLAGRGRRFKPLSDTTPKPLISVGGAPVIDHILAQLGQIEVDELIAVTGYLGHTIESHLESHSPFRYRVIRQDGLSGTGGAVHAAREHLTGPLLIVFGDTVFDTDLSLVERSEADAVIWTRIVDDFENYGIVRTDDQGYMRDIVEKPQVDVGRRANIGLYYVADYEALVAGLDHVVGQPPIDGEWYFTYALNHMIEHGRRIQVADVAGWYDCGNLGALLATNAHLLERATADEGTSSPAGIRTGVVITPPVLIQDGVELRDCKIGPNVTLEAGCRVASSVVRNSIVGPWSNVDGCDISGSLIGPDQMLSSIALHDRIAASGKVSDAD